MIHLFDRFQFNALDLKNRIVMPPMCQYSVTAEDGKPNDWHFTHYTSRAVGGVSLITMEMTGIEPDGRITNNDLGIWSDDQIPAFSRIIDVCHQYDCKMSIQIAHAGRKAQDAQVPLAPSPIQFEGQQYKLPRELSADEINSMVEKYAAGARRAVKAGVDSVEVHGAHGYIIHQFQSPFTNRRKDKYGQDLSLFGSEVVQAVKAELPSGMPLVMRISAVEYVDGGYGLPHAIELCRRYQQAGVDIFHVSSGGEGLPGVHRPGNYPGFQVPLARAIKQALKIPVIAVGMIDDPHLAESVIGNGDADLVAVGRGILRDPYWAIHAAQALGHPPEVPKQYLRAF